jgi:hypothetical protein
MSKQDLISLINFINENDYDTIYNILLKFSGIEEVEPSEEEKKIIENYKNGKIKLVEHDLIEV